MSSSQSPSRHASSRPAGPPEPDVLEGLERFLTIASALFAASDVQVGAVACLLLALTCLIPGLVEWRRQGGRGRE